VTSIQQGRLAHPRVSRAGALRHFFRNQRAFISSLAFFILMIAAFAAISPSIWSKPTVYSAVAISLPTLSIIAVALVFVVAAGEIDLSFGAGVTFSGLVFSYSALAGLNPFLAAILAVLAGIGIGLINGVLIAYIGLSSLIATLGMSFFWAGLADILSNGTGMPLDSLQDSFLMVILVGQIGRLPVQMLWAVGFAILAGVLFNRHKLGAYARYIGDNVGAAREMGVNIQLTRLAIFGFVGLTTGIVGIMISLINVNFYPNAGNGLLLPILAAVFVGGTPMLGGVGSIAGAFVGAMTISFISIGILTSGFSGFYTNFLYGIVIVLSAVVHTVSGIHSDGGRKPSKLFRRNPS
jgi:ribose/xylose/arabinose/galactoside ABC-type transport system permease subunit